MNNEEEMLAIGQKIEDKTATPEEILMFTKEFARLIKEVKEDLS